MLRLILETISDDSPVETREVLTTIPSDLQASNAGAEFVGGLLAYRDKFWNSQQAFAAARKASREARAAEPTKLRGPTPREVRVLSIDPLKEAMTPLKTDEVYPSTGYLSSVLGFEYNAFGQALSNARRWGKTVAVVRGVKFQYEHDFQEENFKVD